MSIYNVLACPMRFFDDMFVELWVRKKLAFLIKAS